MNFANLFNEVKASTNALDRKPTSSVSGFQLSKEQESALHSSFKESSLIYAGAGAGKTRLLIERVAALMKAGANPKKVAVVTFTRKAAEEIKSRLQLRFGPSATLPICGTVHALALSNLKGELANLTISEDDELLPFVQKLREDGLLDSFEDISDSEMLMVINRVREAEGVFGVEAYLAQRFEELLDEAGIVDFTRLLQKAVNVIKPYLNYILVDEVQDLSALQRTYISKTGFEDASFWYIGDSDQSIYAFRGSSSSMMDELTQQVDQTYILSTNYRSVKRVVKHALALISHNPSRKEIKWKAHRAEDGIVEVLHFDSCQQELEAATNWLRESPAGESRAVLARTQVIIQTLKAQGLPAFSVHESKGLEWNNVWVMGCEATLFPHPLGSLDEERRLFYVAMTRAKEQLFMSHVSSRKTKTKFSNKKPSPFLTEAGLVV